MFSVKVLHKVEFDTSNPHYRQLYRYFVDQGIAISYEKRGNVGHCTVYIAPDDAEYFYRWYADCSQE